MNKHTKKTKRLLTGAALVALAAAPLARADYPSTILNQEPVGYWRLNETLQPQNVAGAANLGSLGSTALGTYNSYPTRGVPGPFTGSTAVEFGGGSQSVTTPYQAGLNPTNFSFEAWVNPAVVPKFAYVAASVHIGSPRSGWYMAQDDGTTFGHGSAFVVRMFYQNGTTPAVQLVAPITTPAGSWSHLVLTYDGTNAAFYLNGVAATNAVPIGYVPNVDTQLSLACRSDNNFFWPGSAAEVAMYPGALSATRVAAHYTAGTTAPATYVATVKADAPTLYWRFTEAIDPPAANSGSLGAAGNGLYIYDAKAGQAGPIPPTFLGFDSANKAVTLDASVGVVRVPPLNLNANTVTFSGWFKASGSQPLGTGLVVCDSAQTPSSGLTIDQVYGGLGLGYIWNGNNYGWSPSSDSGLPTLPDGVWAYAALVIEPSQASLYICDANNYANFASVTNSFNVNQPALPFDGPTLFGADAAQSGTVFNGSIDEVAIFDRALSAGDLYTQYAAAVGGVPPRMFADLQGPAGSVAAGDPISFSVDVGGAPPLTYTWKRGGATVATTTNGVLTIATSALTDGGNYTVTVSNGSGAVVSQSVTVTVVNPTAPVIAGVQGFVNRTIYPGGTLALAVSATGGGLKYQWYKNSSAIATATTSAFTIGNATNSDAGTYSVSITNSLGASSNGPVAITVPTVAAGSYEALMVAAAPEAWWRLDEPAGSTNMFDGMGRHDGFYTNLNGIVPPVVLASAGALNNDTNTAASFNANGGLGVAPYSDALNANICSVEAWVKTSDLDGEVPFSTCLPSSSTASGFWAQSVAGWWLGDCNGGSFGNDGNVNAAAQITAGQWSHVVVIYDGTEVISGSHYPFVLYVNGATDGYVWGGAGRNASIPFVIGGRGGSTTAFADLLFNGQVDEVAVYQRKLTAAEITSHFKGRFGSTTVPYFIGSFLPQTVTPGKSISYSTLVQGSFPITVQWYKNGAAIAGATNTTFALTNTVVSDTGTYTLWATNSVGVISQSASLTVVAPVGYANVTNDLVLHLRFDGDATDSSGRGNNGTLVGSPGFVTGVIGSKALQYATTTTTNGALVSFGSASYVTLGAPADLRFGAGDSFTIGLWVNLPVNSASDDTPFIGNAKNSNNNPGWDLSPTSGSGGWQWCLNDGVRAGMSVTNNFDMTGASGSISDGAWHNLVLTVDRTAKFASTYLDGILVVTRDLGALGSLDTGGTVNIGQDPSGTYFDKNYQPTAASLDDIGVWRRALTPLEVAEIQSAGSTSGRSFDTVSPVGVTIGYSRSGSSVTLTWPSGTLLQSDALGATAAWAPVSGAAAPSYTFTPATAQKYYRVQQ